MSRCNGVTVSTKSRSLQRKYLLFVSRWVHNKEIWNLYNVFKRTAWSLQSNEGMAWKPIKCGRKWQWRHCLVAMATRWKADSWIVQYYLVIICIYQMKTLILKHFRYFTNNFKWILWFGQSGFTSMEKRWHNKYLGEYDKSHELTQQN